MLDYIHFENYRGFSNLKLENLKPINIIVGPNNVGKTAVLEGLAISFTGAKNEHIAQLFRKSPRQEEKSAYWDWLVHREATESIASIQCGGKTFDVRSEMVEIKSPEHQALSKKKDSYTGRWEKSSGFTISLGEGWVSLRKLFRDGTLPPLSTNVVARPSNGAEPESVSKLYNQIAPLNPDGEDEIQGFLKNSIEPRLKRIRYALAKDTKTHLAYVQLEGLQEMIPFTQLGQAFSSTFHLYCLLYAERPDILLIDEIENGIYFEGLDDYWKGLHAALAAKGTQLFATTHSFECMKAAHEEAKKLDGEYPINFIRLQRDPDDSSKIIATEFGEEAMDGAIQQGWDMR